MVPEVVLTIDTDAVDDDGPMSPDEIARVLSAMGRLQPLEIPDDVAVDLDTSGRGAESAWHRSRRRPE